MEEMTEFLKDMQEKMDASLKEMTARLVAKMEAN
jgi:hypothetical protein